MTEFVITKAMIGVAAVPLVTIAAIDIATQGSIINVVSLLITTIGVCVTAWIAYKQASLKKTVEVLEKNTNGLKEALIASTAKENLAEGKVIGIAQAEMKAAIIAVAKAEGASEIVNKGKAETAAAIVEKLVVKLEDQHVLDKIEGNTSETAKNIEKLK